MSGKVLQDSLLRFELPALKFVHVSNEDIFQFEQQHILISLLFSTLIVKIIHAPQSCYEFKIQSRYFF